MNQERCFKLIVASLATIFTWLLGAWDTALIVLITFMILDYVTGVIRGYVNNQLSSNTGFKGIVRKAVIFIILIVAVSLDRLLNNNSWAFRTLVCYFYIANEGISLLENAIGLGVPVPARLKNALVQLKDGEKKEMKEGM